MSNNFYDIAIVGAGIVGLTVAYDLLKRNSSLKIVIVEKERQVAVHASGRNSGVVHCGIFYGSDTLKAKVCAKGAKHIGEFASEHKIAYKKCGKVILATNEKQLTSIDKLLKNASENGITANLINDKEVSEIEPFAAPALAAIYCPDTAIIDSKAVVFCLQKLLVEKGVTFIFDCKVLDAKKQMLQTSKGSIAFGYLFNCAGAFADNVAKMFGLAEDYALIPFKGIYWKLSEESKHKVRANIYPLPDPALPFLGVHLTRVISGDVYIGPTAIPALGRENYNFLEGVLPSEAFYIIKTLAQMYIKNQQNFRLLTHNEVSKYVKNSFYETTKKLMPSITINDMVPTGKVGIRPQLVNIKSKKLEMDYIFEENENSIHVLNTISPAFTSSFAFAEMIVEKSRVN